MTDTDKLARAKCSYCGGARRFQVISPVSDGAWADCFCVTIPKAQAAMQERCASVADELGGERVERGPDGDLRRFDMESRHGRGDAVLNAMRVRAQTIAKAIRSQP